MTEPRRWLESTDVEPEVGRLLLALEPPRPMSRAECARSAQAVARIAATPIGWSAVMAHQGLAITMLAGMAAGGLALWAGAYRWPAAPPVASATTALAFPPPRPSTTPVQALAPAPSAAVPLPPTSAAPSSAPTRRASHPDWDQTLARQVAELERARAELATDPAAALAKVAQHGRDFPTSQLAIEREFIAIEALRKMGRLPEARTRAQRLKAQAPSSLYEQRLDHLFDPPAAAAER